MRCPKVCGDSVLFLMLFLGGCQSAAPTDPELKVSVAFNVEDQNLTLRVRNAGSFPAHYYPGLYERQGFIENVFLLVRPFGDDPPSGICHPVWFSSDALVQIPVRMTRIRGHETKQISCDFDGMMGFMDWAKMDGFTDGAFVRFDAVFYTDNHLNHPLRSATPWFRLQNRRLVSLTPEEQAELPESTETQWKSYMESLTQLR